MLKGYFDSLLFCFFNNFFYYIALCDTILGTGIPPTPPPTIFFFKYWISVHGKISLVCVIVPWWCKVWKRYYWMFSKSLYFLPMHTRSHKVYNMIRSSWWNVERCDTFYISTFRKIWAVKSMRNPSAPLYSPSVVQTGDHAWRMVVLHKGGNWMPMESRRSLSSLTALCCHVIKKHIQCNFVML